RSTRASTMAVRSSTASSGSFRPCVPSFRRRARLLRPPAARRQSCPHPPPTPRRPPLRLQLLRLRRLLRRARKSGADELAAPWRVGARPSTGNGGDQAGELERGTEFVTVEVKLTVQSVVIGEPGEQAGAERVAGADRVD